MPLNLIGNIIRWLVKNPIVIATAILSISTLFFFVQSKYHQRKAESALLRALGAEKVLDQAQQREKSLKALQKRHRKEDAEIEKSIGHRDYFDTVGSMWPN